MGDNKISYFSMNVILLIVFIGLINLIFTLHRFALVLEVLGLLGIMLLAIVAMVAAYNSFRWGYGLLAVLLAVIFFDALLVYGISSTASGYFIPTLIFAVIGFVLALYSMREPEEVVEEKVTKEFKPGKYIASKTGSKFHSPKCDWGKRIKKGNAVWFNSKEEAKKAGYKADDCVK